MKVIANSGPIIALAKLGLLIEKNYSMKTMWNCYLMRLSPEMIYGSPKDWLIRFGMN